jgi:hypothetical protein
MAGYAGYSMSNNAVEAYNDYKMPISELRKFLGIKDISFTPCEWHHSSKFYNSVDFYDARKAIICGDIKRLSNAKPNPLQLFNRFLVKCIIIKEAGLKCTAKIDARFESLSIAADMFIAAKNGKRAAVRVAKEAEKKAAEEKMLAEIRAKSKIDKHFKLQRIAQCHRLTSQKITYAFAGKEVDNVCGIYSQIRNWFKQMSLEEALNYAI